MSRDRVVDRARIAPTEIITTPEDNLWTALMRIESFRTVPRGQGRTAKQIPGSAINSEIQQAIRMCLQRALSKDGSTPQNVEKINIQTVELHTIPTGTKMQDWHHDVPANTGQYYTGIIPVTSHWGTMFPLQQGTSHSGWTVQTKGATLHKGTTIHRGPPNETSTTRRMIAVVFTDAADPNVVHGQ